jgi:hypothetical protein
MPRAPLHIRVLAVAAVAHFRALQVKYRRLHRMHRWFRVCAHSATVDFSPRQRAQEIGAR